MGNKDNGAQQPEIVYIIVLFLYHASEEGSGYTNYKSI